MLHLLISLLSLIIITKQTTATSLILFPPLWQILYLSLAFYFPLRINKDYPSNCNNPEFLASAESNSCNQKTLSHAITKNIVSAHLFHSIQSSVVFILKRDMANYLWQTISVINYQHQILLRQKWRKVPWLLPGMAEFKLMKSAGPAMTPQSELNYLCRVIPKRRMQ